MAKKTVEHRTAKDILGPETEHAVGPDGVARTAKEEQRLNHVIGQLFRGRNGKEALAYLRSITLETVAGPNVQPNGLLHLEGQRYIVGVILERIELAKDPSRARKFRRRQMMGGRHQEEQK